MGAALKSVSAPSTKSSQSIAISRIRLHLRTAGEAMYQAAKVYVGELDKDPGFVTVIREAFPALTTAFLRDLEWVGRGHLDRRILELGLTCGSRLKSLPITEQRRLLDNGLEVWTGDETRIIPLAECGPRVLVQCIGRNHVRTPEEQASWYEEQHARHRQSIDATKTKTIADGSEVTYRLDRKQRCVRIVHSCVLTVADLKAILEELT